MIRPEQRRRTHARSDFAEAMIASAPDVILIMTHSLDSVGGPDGLARNVLDRAQATLAFGRMTWPHRLVRVMLAEQIYRASTILSGHPYHRA